MVKITSKTQLKLIYSFLRQHIRTFVIAVICVAVAIDLIFIGNLYYAVKWAYCGQQPVLTTIYTEHLGIESPPVHADMWIHPRFFQYKNSVVPTISSKAELSCTLNNAKAVADHEASSSDLITIHY